jgi:hypothetical protein
VCGRVISLAELPETSLCSKVSKVITFIVGLGFELSVFMKAPA